MKQFGTSLFPREPPLSTNPPISEQFFRDPLFVPILKTRNPPNFRGGTMETNRLYSMKCLESYQEERGQDKRDAV